MRGGEGGVSVGKVGVVWGRWGEVVGAWTKSADEEGDDEARVIPNRKQNVFGTRWFFI